MSVRRFPVCCGRYGVGSLGYNRAGPVPPAVGAGICRKSSVAAWARAVRRTVFGKTGPSADGPVSV